MSNNTTRSQNGAMVKHYQSIIAKDQESVFLKICHKTKLTPEMIDEKESSITMTMVRGETLLSLIEAVWREERTPEEGKWWLQLLLDWFCKIFALFQKKTGELPVLEDAHLKNFILNTRTHELTGIDFEHRHKGKAAESFGTLLAYTQSYRGAQSPVGKELLKWLQQEIQTRFQVSQEKLEYYAQSQRELLQARRKTAFFRRNTTAAILLGGKSKRMGQSKELLQANKYTFFETILYELQTFDHIVASVSKGQDKHVGISQIEDIYQEKGPLGALHGVMSRLETDWVFLIACDMPAIKEAGLYRLFAEVTESQDCLIPIYGGYRHPLAGIYHKRLLPTVEKLLLEDRCRMQDLLDRANTYYLQVEEEIGIQLCNINTQKEYDIWIGKECKNCDGRTSKENHHHL